MKNIIIVFLATINCQLSTINCTAQDFKYYRYENDFLSKEFHQGRREALRAKLPDSSVAFFFTNPERTRSNDVEYLYHQDPDFYYLTGFTEPNAVLILFKSPQTINGKKGNEFLFVPERDPSQEVWTGRRAGVEGAMQITGVQNVFLASVFDSISFDTTLVRLYSMPKEIMDKRGNTDLYNLIDAFKKKCNCKDAQGKEVRLKKMLADLREVKQPEEMPLLRKAVQISCEGHNEIMRTLKPGMHEYDAQAIGEYVFKRNGAEFEGYPSICGGGENSCILHYESNRRTLQSGDLQLDDMAAEYHGYSADVTRTIPVNGKFSPEQKLIYELVLKAQQAGFEACKTGNEYLAPHEAAVDVIKRGLMELGIIKDSGDYRLYFIHHTSHYLGLDVHDAGRLGKLKPGNVITVEPGIYIPEGSKCDKKWWNIGVRIEDDVLITENGYENLSASSPRSVADIEAMMKQKPLYLK